MSDTCDAPLPQLPRRSLTLPTKLNRSLRRSSESYNPSENDLFYHPSAKVVHFAPRSIAPIPFSTAPSDFDYPVDTVETLAWRSPTERTVALAPLRLEKVYGLTVFLKCGSVVHAILKNSQCWCVDGESTFVLRIRPLTYYRIELPNETERDQELVTQMKGALPMILRYEVTPCPFKRGFTVEIPEEAKAPRRKKAWRPKGRRESAPVQSEYCQESLDIKGAATPDSLSAGEDTDDTATDGSSFTPKGSSTKLETIPDDHEQLPEPISIPGPTRMPSQSVREAQQSFQTLLSRFEDTPESQDEPELSHSSSVDSFHSFQSLDITPEPYLTPPSPTTSPDDTQLMHDSGEMQESLRGEDFVCQDRSKPPLHTEQTTQHTPAQSLSPEQNFTLPRTPGSFSSINSAKTTDSNPNLTTMSIEFRRRSKASREREISPMPPASTLILANPEKHESASLIQKTASLVLVPPIQLLLVLIHIAARIVVGPGLDSPAGEFHRKLERQASGSHEALDDYDLPLAPDCSRKPSVSDHGYLGSDSG
ncbi:inheritance of peroxisomes protein 1-domain-containing protein [Aspergillus varians]